MVAQKRTCRFPRKVHRLFGDKTIPERQRSDVAQITLWQRSCVAQGNAQVGFTEMILRRPQNVF